MVCISCILFPLFYPLLAVLSAWALSLSAPLFKALGLTPPASLAPAMACPAPKPTVPAAAAAPAPTAAAAGAEAPPPPPSAPPEGAAAAAAPVAAQ